MSGHFRDERQSRIYYPRSSARLRFSVSMRAVPEKYMNLFFFWVFILTLHVQRCVVAERTECTHTYDDLRVSRIIHRLHRTIRNTNYIQTNSYLVRSDK